MHSLKNPSIPLGFSGPQTLHRNTGAVYLRAMKLENLLGISKVEPPYLLDLEKLPSLKLTASLAPEIRPQKEAGSFSNHQFQFDSLIAKYITQTLYIYHIQSGFVV